MIATVAGLIYNILYRSISGYSSGEIVNIFSTIFSYILVSMILSLAFYIVVKNAEAKSKIFTYSLIVLAIISMAAVLFSDTSNKFVFGGDKGLIAGHIFIGGILAAFLIPYFYRHSKMFI